MRCVGRENVELLDAEILNHIRQDPLGVGERVAHRDQARLDAVRPQAFDAAHRLGMGPAALEIDAVLIVDLRRPVESSTLTVMP